MADTGFTFSRIWWLLMLAAAGAVLFDQAIKLMVVALMPYGAAHAITAFFNVVHVRNPGAAFSILADAGGWQRYALTALGIGVSVALGWMLRRGLGSRLETAAYVLIISGALGNVADRLARGAVVDYLDFHWRGWHWPAFNLADVYITFGAFFLIIGAFRSFGQASAPRSRVY